jgi:hypothetical protein
MKAEVKTWNELFIDIGYKQAAMCNENSFSYINCLISADGIRNLMVSVYNSLITKKLLSKIENLSIEEKNILWIQTKEFAANKLNLNETISLSKSLYAIEYLLNNPI